MSPQIVFYVLIGILTLEFLFQKWLDNLNASYYNKPIPEELSDVYDQDKYEKSQAYKKKNHIFSLYSTVISFVATLLFFFFDGFYWVQKLVDSWTTVHLLNSLTFIGVLFFASFLLSLPFSYYSTFVIEERFGFNKSTRKIFLMDKVKGLFLTLVFGSGILVLIILLYQNIGKNFWIWAWVVITIFSFFMNLFYSNLIVPLFNKQTPLEGGELKTAITSISDRLGFKLNNIFVIDGSKRSTKANAYFTGFGPKKRVVLFDTLINDLSTDEIIAVLAHEIGHYKKKHTIWNLVLGIMQTGIVLFLFSLLIDSDLLAQALGLESASFHIGMIAFSLLYSPFNIVLSYLMNLLSRKFEYQADHYAKTKFKPSSLISALKKLSRNNLSNLTPHPLFVAVHYSHPTLLQRIQKLGE